METSVLVAMAAAAVTAMVGYFTSIVLNRSRDKFEQEVSESMRGISDSRRREVNVDLLRELMGLNGQLYRDALQLVREAAAVEDERHRDALLSSAEEALQMAKDQHLEIRRLIGALQEP